MQCETVLLLEVLVNFNTQLMRLITQVHRANEPSSERGIFD